MVVNAKNNEVRVIPINQTLYKELLVLPRKSENENVFSDQHGRPIGDIKKGFLSALKRAGIADFHFHDLRHTFGLQMVMQGVDINLVK